MERKRGVLVDYLPKAPAGIPVIVSIRVKASVGVCAESFDCMARVDEVVEDRCFVRARSRLPD